MKISKPIIQSCSAKLFFKWRVTGQAFPGGPYTTKKFRTRKAAEHWIAKQTWTTVAAPDPDACKFGPVEHEGRFIGEQFCYTHSTHNCSEGRYED